MNARKRLSTVYRGSLADRIPWAPIVTKATLSTYPDRVQTEGTIAFTRAVGGDVLYRGTAHRIEQPQVEIARHAERDTQVTEYQTPFGTLRQVYRSGSLVERQIKTLSDYEAFRFVYENQRFVLDEDALREAEHQVGDAGIVTASIGPTPVQRLLQFELGVEGFAYHLADCQRELEGLMAVMHAKNLELYELVASSSAEFVMLYENTSTTMVSPAIYDCYSLEHVRGFVEAMHAQGKVAIVHMCGKVNRLLHLIRQTGLDAIDCLTPAPTGDVDFEEAFEILGDSVIIHGLLDPSEWTHRPIEEIERNIQALLTPEILKRPFVFCTAADGLPGIPMEKFEAIGRIMSRYQFA